MKDVLKIAESLQEAEIEVLKYLSKSKKATTGELSELTKLQEVAIGRAAMWLENKKLVTQNTKTTIFVTLDELGKKYAKSKLPELAILEYTEEPKSLDELKKQFEEDEIKFAIGHLKRKGLIVFDNSKVKAITYLGKVTSTPESKLLTKLSKGALDINSLNDEEQHAYADLKKRSIVKDTERTITTLEITSQGKDVAKELSSLSKNRVGALTPEMIKTGSWKGKNFRRYDVEAIVPEITAGRKHPMTVAMEIIRQVFLEMGFKEMKGPWVETAFWCMDSMWIPQDHPARDIQDTFFIEGKGKLPNPKLVQAVKSVQENGGKTGSTGYGTEWNEELAKQLLLRTHSTATTFRQFGLNGVGMEDCKYFYLAKVFRNEATSFKATPEFNHAEGFVIGDNLGVADLMGFIKEFYARLGFHKIRFKPNYNPYTEPSLQAYYYDDKHKKWYALINSGIFRPEALAPYGITKSVIAWGMGPDRMAALLCNQKNIKDLYGANSDLNWIRGYKQIKW